MKVTIACHTLDVFARTTDDAMAEQLMAAFVRAGHAVEITRIRFQASDAEQALECAAVVRFMDFSDRVDLLVCLSPVAALIQHPLKVYWYDDLYVDEFPLGTDEIDARLLAEARSVYARSAPAVDRLDALAAVNCLVLERPADAAGWDAAAELLLVDRLVSA